MRTFRKPVARSVIFQLGYDDGRTAYLWVDGHVKSDEDHLVGGIAKQQQEQGLIPAGTVTSIRRVR
jgi:prepilin-type processing-associated H-X9-DG protein